SWCATHIVVVYKLAFLGETVGGDIRKAHLPKRPYIKLKMGRQPRTMAFRISVETLAASHLGSEIPLMVLALCMLQRIKRRKRVNWYHMGGERRPPSSPVLNTSAPQTPAIDNRKNAVIKIKFAVSDCEVCH